mmetsp:Transcript_10448/g.19544  ORF Transcript_10448/g.19544 Transcript_10448/m.19544 type:complete len:153 (-) Transcript_10448:464-922(-)
MAMPVPMTVAIVAVTIVLMANQWGFLLNPVDNLAMHVPITTTSHFASNRVVTNWCKLVNFQLAASTKSRRCSTRHFNTWPALKSSTVTPNRAFRNSQLIPRCANAPMICVAPCLVQVIGTCAPIIFEQLVQVVEVFEGEYERNTYVSSPLVS